MHSNPLGEPLHVVHAIDLYQRLMSFIPPAECLCKCFFFYFQTGTKADIICPHPDGDATYLACEQSHQKFRLKKLYLTLSGSKNLIHQERASWTKLHLNSAVGYWQVDEAFDLCQCYSLCRRGWDATWGSPTDRLMTVMKVNFIDDVRRTNGMKYNQIKQTELQ